MYAYVSGRPNRLPTFRTSMRTWATQVDAMFNNSALETGGTARLRWVTSDCQLDVAAAEVSAGAETNFNTMLADLGALGYTRNDRKYLVWFDSDSRNTSYCGLGTIWQDDSPGPMNASNQYVGYARVDYQCWDFAESHEIMHTLGGVQLSAPHSTGGWHCTDENDQMCYPDGPGVTMTYPCSAAAASDIFDCGHDDYFDTSPVPGTYLAQHWNAARSDFIVGGEASPADLEAPILQPPGATYIAGQTMGTTVLMRITWAEAADSSGVTSYQLQRKRGTGGWVDIGLAPGATSADTAVVVGARYEFRVRATDGAGNVGPWAYGGAAPVTRLEETATSISYNGLVPRRALSGASANHVRRTAAAGRTATLNFTGTSVAFVTTTGPARGIVAIRLDGGEWQSVDLYGAATIKKQVAWAASVAAGAHTLEVSVTGTRNAASGSGRIDIDAFLTR